MKKETTEKREYYRLYRCVGGFILSLAVIDSLLSMSTSTLMLIANLIFEDSLIAELVYGFCYYGVMIYGYYLGYRIFFKKYFQKIFDIQLVKSKQIIICLIVCVLSFFIMQSCWSLWEIVLNQLGLHYGGSSADVQLKVFDVLYICLLAPICEEIVFRGWILKALKPYGPVVAVVLSAVAFGLYHGTIHQSAPAILIGLVLAIVTIKFDSLIPAILIHISNNTYSTIQMFYPTIKIDNKITFIATALALLIFLIFNFKKIPYKQFTAPIKLFYHSISYILFIIIYLVFIVIDLFNFI